MVLTDSVYVLRTFHVENVHHHALDRDMPVKAGLRKPTKKRIGDQDDCYACPLHVKHDSFNHNCSNVAS